MPRFPALILLLACANPETGNGVPPPDGEAIAIDATTADGDDTAAPCPYATDQVDLASFRTRGEHLPDYYSTYPPASAGEFYWSQGTLLPQFWVTLRGTPAEPNFRIHTGPISQDWSMIYYTMHIESPVLWPNAFHEDSVGFRFFAGFQETDGTHTFNVGSISMDIRNLPEHYTNVGDDTWCTYPATITWSWQDQARPECHGGGTYEVTVRPADDQICPATTPEPEPPVYLPVGDTADIPP